MEMKPDFKKILRAFDDEPEVESGPRTAAGDYFYPNKDWERRFCKHCKLARAVFILGSDDREYVCNRLESGTNRCPYEEADRIGYSRSVPLIPGHPVPGGSGNTVDLMNHRLDSISDGLDDAIEQLELHGDTRKKKSHWSRSKRAPYFTCSACGGHSMTDSHKYCPMCGTLME